MSAWRVPARGVPARGGVPAGGICPGGCLLSACWDTHPPGQTPLLWTEWLTERCKNITWSHFIWKSNCRFSSLGWPTQHLRNWSGWIWTNNFFVSLIMISGYVWISLISCSGSAVWTQPPQMRSVYFLVVALNWDQLWETADWFHKTVIRELQFMGRKSCWMFTGLLRSEGFDQKIKELFW